MNSGTNESIKLEPLFEPFGTICVTSVSGGTDTFRDMLGCLESTEELAERLVDICRKVLAGSISSLDRMYVGSVSYVLVGRCVDRAVKAVKQAYVERTAAFGRKIAGKLIDGTLELTDFTEGFVLHSGLSDWLATVVLPTFDTSVRYRPVGGGGTRSLIMLMSDYLFYHNVINKTYENSEGRHKKLYSALLDVAVAEVMKCGKPTDKWTDSICKLVNIYKYFNDMSKRVKDEDREKAFDIVNDDRFPKDIGDNKEIVACVSTNLNEAIIKHGSMAKGPERARFAEDILRMATFTNTFSGGIKFPSYHKFLLRKRVVEGLSDTRLEASVLQMFAVRDDSANIYSKLTLIDAARSAELTAEFRKLKYKVKPSTNMTMTAEEITAAKEVVNVTVFRNGLFPDVEGGAAVALKLPKALLPYFSIYGTFYRTKFGERELGFDYHKSVGRACVAFGDDIVTLGMTVPQMAIIALFDEFDQLTEKDIIDKLEMSEVTGLTLISGLVESTILITNTDKSLSYNGSPSPEKTGNSILSYAEKPTDGNLEKGKLAMGKLMTVLANGGDMTAAEICGALPELSGDLVRNTIAESVRVGFVTYDSHLGAYCVKYDESDESESEEEEEPTGTNSKSSEVTIKTVLGRLAH